MLKEPPALPDDVSMDTSREYGGFTNAIIAGMYRLCLPENIPDYGSSPLFSPRRENEKFWRRTGYELHQYRSNYDKLKKIKASDPHPKRDRKRFDPENVDSNGPMALAWMERHPGLIDEDYPEATAVRTLVQTSYIVR